MHWCPDHLTKCPTGLARLARAGTNDWRAFARLCSTRILPRLKPNVDERFLTAALADYRQARQGLDELATGEPGTKPIHPQYVTRIIDELAADER